MIAVFASLWSGIDNAEETLKRLAMNCLIVIGAYVVGYIGSGILYAALDRWVFKKKTPDPIKKTIRVIVGIVVAVIVASLLFWGGGGGGEGPGGPGPGVGNEKSDKKGDEPTNPNSKDKATPEPVKLPEGKAERTLLAVTFLGGGDVTSGRAYMLGNEKKNFAELTDSIKKRKAAEPNGVKLILGRTGVDPVSRQSTGVKALEEWAEKEKIGYEWPEDDKKTP
jgi:hypothetical protein